MLLQVSHAKALDSWDHIISFCWYEMVVELMLQYSNYVSFSFDSFWLSWNKIYSAWCDQKRHEIVTCMDNWFLYMIVRFPYSSCPQESRILWVMFNLLHEITLNYTNLKCENWWKLKNYNLNLNKTIFSINCPWLNRISYWRDDCRCKVKRTNIRLCLKIFLIWIAVIDLFINSHIYALKTNFRLSKKTLRRTKLINLVFLKLRN